MTLYASPGEPYARHVSWALQEYEALGPQYLPALARVLQVAQPDAEEALRTAVLLHDVGKLLGAWQRALETGKFRPAHATIGAAAVWLALQTASSDLRCAAAMAVAIHHTDFGLPAEALERPDQHAILQRLVDIEGRLRWHSNWRSAMADLPDHPVLPTDLSVEVLANMAGEIRLWSRGGSWLQLHRRRLMACACHRVLQVADLSAAARRLPRKDEQAPSPDLAQGGKSVMW